MAKEPNQAAPGADKPADPATGGGKAGDALSRADVARRIGAKVRVFKQEKDGGQIVVERRATADDVLSFRVDGGIVIAVTVDGRKHQAELG